MSNVRISSCGSFLRSGEELFNLKNEIVGYTGSPGEAIMKSCDVETGVAFIETYERFYTGHDDSEIIVVIRDQDNHILWKWAFDHVIGSGATVEADTLICYLEGKFGCPVKRASWFC